MADVDQLLRAVFEVCEATEDIEPKNDFERGRVFEAKHIRRGIGAWFQDTFCGRTHMGEPVIGTAGMAEIEYRSWFANGVSRGQDQTVPPSTTDGAPK